MRSQNLSRAALLAVVLIIASLIFWELYLRNQGQSIEYDDGDSLWSTKRERVYQPNDKATVFIGSSRIKFDLDIDTWEKTTGEEAVQLAYEGSSPLPVLEDLGNDNKFKGKLIIDVTEGLFFSHAPPALERPRKSVAYAKKVSPAQKASFYLNEPLEASFVFLDKEDLSLNALLERLRIRNRPGVFTMPLFPAEFNTVTKDRQDIMTPRFLTEPMLQDSVKHIWQFLGNAARSMPPMPYEAAQKIMLSVKASVDKIRSRGGQVIFVRTPSSQPMLGGEKKGFPREKFWNQLLLVAKADGVHFEDYPQIAHFTCPEWSHLSPQDAIIFTKEFIKILNQKNWFKPSSTASL